MTSLAQELENIDRQLSDAMTSAVAARASDAELLDVVQALGRMQRRLDGAIVTATDQVVGRDQCERDARLSTRAGCRDAAELLRRSLLVDGHTARRYVTAAGAVHQEMDITSGALLPGKYPKLAEALADGFLSISGFLACIVPLQKAVRISIADRLVADSMLARFATGRPLDGTDSDPDSPAPLPTTDELAALAAHIVSRLDPDGAEPSDRAGKRRRHVTIGKLRDGSVPMRGELLPEVAAQLQKLLDSLMNPKAENKAGAGAGSCVRFRPSDDSGDGDGDGDDGDEGDDAGFEAKYSSGSADHQSPVDPDRADGLPAHKVSSPPADAADLRTQAQKRHDAFASIIMVAAASGGMPDLGGAAPTLVVSITAEDFANRSGRARIEGAGYDVPIGAADHAACAGGVQRVLLDKKGAIVAIGTSARIFNAHQRRAIVLRDRECLIPGCGVPAEWCELHHVDEHSKGGPTHTSNGIPLCWHHHRTLDEGIWRIRMRHGLPEIRGPGWWDPYARWRSPRLDYRAVDDALDQAVDQSTSRWHEPAWNTR